MTLIEDRSPDVAVTEYEQEIERLRSALQRISTLDYEGVEPNSRKIAKRALAEPTRRSNVPEAKYGFDTFWQAFPRRNGVKAGKGQALTKWGAMTLDQRRDAYRAAVKYAAAVTRGDTIAKDASRFLSNGYWRDWLEATVPSSTVPQRPHWVPPHAVYDTVRGQWVA